MTFDEFIKLLRKRAEDEAHNGANNDCFGAFSVIRKRCLGKDQRGGYLKSLRMGITTDLATLMSYKSIFRSLKYMLTTSLE
ncbi:MAG: hypothetical protein HQK96_13700 [Nitrospirae bacterium]|nr:hypothetical protein [Nitrospirota bacterium]